MKVSNIIRLIPIVREGSEKNFADVPVQDAEINGIKFKTAPLRFNNKFSLLGITQSQALLDAGIIDQTDSIDDIAYIESVTVKIMGGDPVTIDLGTKCQFETGRYGNVRKLDLTKTFTHDFDNETNVSFTLNADINLELGDTNAAVIVNSVKGIPGLTGIEFLGYTLSAHRTNLNRRPRT